MRTAWICLHIRQAVQAAVGKKGGGRLHLKDFMLDVDRYESYGSSSGDKWSRMKEIKNKFLQFAKLHNKAAKRGGRK